MFIPRSIVLEYSILAEMILYSDALINVYEFIYS